MQSIEERIVERWPAWFAAATGRWTRPLLRGLRRYTRIDQAEQLVAALPHLSGLEFVEVALWRLDVRYRVDDIERQRIPVSGGCLIVANHPLGALDALLLKLVGDIRRDVMIVANDALGTRYLADATGGDRPRRRCGGDRERGGRTRCARRNPGWQTHPAAAGRRAGNRAARSGAAARTDLPRRRRTTTDSQESKIS